MTSLESGHQNDPHYSDAELGDPERYMACWGSHHSWKGGARSESSYILKVWALTTPRPPWSFGVGCVGITVCGHGMQSSAQRCPWGPLWKDEALVRGPHEVTSFPWQQNQQSWNLSNKATTSREAPYPANLKTLKWTCSAVSQCSEIVASGEPIMRAFTDTADIGSGLTPDTYGYLPRGTQR